MDTKDYTVKGLKTMPTGDGGAFDFTLMRNGVKVAHVHDDGYGGEVDIEYLDAKEEKAMKEYIATLPKEGELDVDAELFVCAVLDKHENTQVLKRWCKKEVVFRVKGDKEGTYRTQKPNKGRVFDKAMEEKIIAYVKEKYGDAIEEIVNESLKK